jgi:hypothetical protein
MPRLRGSHVPPPSPERYTPPVLIATWTVSSAGLGSTEWAAAPP